MRLDLLSLRLFLAIHEEASLTRAAQREGISLSALSKRLSELERLLRTTLFSRNHHRMDPTPAGDALAPHVRRLLGDVARIESEMADFTAGLKGRVRIWSNGWAIVQYLPEDLSAFMASHPLVRIELEEAVTPAIVEAVAEGHAEIGVFAGDFPAPGLHVVPYRADALVAVMPAGHALAAQDQVRLDEMLRHDMIGPKQGSAIDALLVQATIGKVFRPRIRVAGPEAVAAMAAAGLGIGLVPARQAARYHRVLGIAVRPLAEAPWATRQLRLCTQPPERLSPACRQLLTQLHEGSAFPAAEGALPK